MGGAFHRWPWGGAVYVGLQNLIADTRPFPYPAEQMGRFSEAVRQAAG